MIKGIASGEHVIVTGSSGFMPYVNMSNPSAGMLRYNGNSQTLEVYDGLSWLGISADYPSIHLSESARAAINWVMRKMAEEAELEKLAHDHPAIKAAYENLKRAEDQLKTTVILSKETEKPLFHHPV